MATDYLTELPRFLVHLRERPQMVVFPVNLYTVMSFLYGYDTAIEGRLLDGFREWLALRIHPGLNLGIADAALCLTFPGYDDLGTILSDPAMHREVVHRLFELFDAFLAERNQPGGLERIRQAQQDRVGAYLHDDNAQGSSLP